MSFNGGAGMSILHHTFVVRFTVLFHGRHGGHGIVQCAPTLTSIQDLFQPNTQQTPVAAVTIYSAPDDGRKERPKHVEHTCSC